MECCSYLMPGMWKLQAGCARIHKPRVFYSASCGGSMSAILHTGAKMENALLLRSPFSVRGTLPTTHSQLGSRGKPRLLWGTNVRASRSTKQTQLFPELQRDDGESCRLDSNSTASTSGVQDVPGDMSFSGTSSVLYMHAACAGICLLSAGSASAIQLSSQVSWLPAGSMHDAAIFTPHEAAELADLLRVPEVSLSPFQVVTFLLQNPPITLGVAAALYFLVPRIFRAVVRYLVVPLALALALYVVSLNPSAATGFAQGSFNCAPSSCSLRACCPGRAPPHAVMQWGSAQLHRCGHHSRLCRNSLLSA